MKRLLLALAALLVLFSARPALAQGYQQPATSPYIKPPLSPYLNMLRGGSPAVNYFGLVRPEQQTYSTLQQLQTVTGQLQERTITNQVPQGTSQTGHTTRFMSYNQYFFTVGGGEPAEWLDPASANGLAASGHIPRLPPRTVSRPLPFVWL